ncbi:ribosomal protection-like ABC-F family protein [Anaerocolumna jejuensis]|uniref:ribosomal protection-like ABC-F family protein n=1 Tax=Anaerocolumna jejuensis TaxID=259063 RepID=UPI003F7BF83A
MKDLFVNGVKKYMDTTLVLNNITFMVNEGEKAGIVGENGSGKTTVLKLIAGILTLNHCAGYPYAPVPPGYDEGWVILPKEVTCAYLNQIPDYEAGVKVIDVLNLAFEEVYALEAELRSLEEDMQHAKEAELERILKRYDNCLKVYESKGGYEVTEKLNRICKGLKFSEEFLNKDFNILSGGEKTTAALGKLLMDSPDILLLDEPTNHLDMESVEWLEEYVRNYKGTVIIVSHDRYFLDHTVTKIIEFEEKESDTYQGNYTEYLRLKEEKIRLWQETFREQQKKIGEMETSVKQLREWASKGGNNKFYKRAASIQNRLDKIERIERPVTKKKDMKLNFIETGRSGNIVIKAEGLKKAYGGKVLFEDGEVQVYYGERVALIGQNGSGKTTFLKMLLGEEVPDDGIIELGSSVKAAYLPQQLVFSNEELTVVECFREDISILEGAAREYLSKFLFFGSTVYKKVKHLSGGERVRLMLARLIFHEANLLILDEPTNHLDTSSIENIENTLEAFKGTVFFISHDRYFINKAASRVLSLEGGKLISYAGNYDDYKEIKEKLNRQAENKPADTSAKKDSTKVKPHGGNSSKKEESKKEERKKEAADRKKSLETRIEELEKEISSIGESMNSSDILLEELDKLYRRQEELSAELEFCMEEWMDCN